MCACRCAHITNSQYEKRNGRHNVLVLQKGQVVSLCLNHMQPAPDRSLINDNDFSTINSLNEKGYYTGNSLFLYNCNSLSTEYPVMKSKLNSPRNCNPDAKMDKNIRTVNVFLSSKNIVHTIQELQQIMRAECDSSGRKKSCKCDAE